MPRTSSRRIHEPCSASPDVQFIYHLFFVSFIAISILPVHDVGQQHRQQLRPPREQQHLQEVRQLRKGNDTRPTYFRCAQALHPMQQPSGRDQELIYPALCINIVCSAYGSPPRKHLCVTRAHRREIRLKQLCSYVPSLCVYHIMLAKCH